MDYYQQDFCNCTKSNCCQEGYTCCTENVPDGKVSTLGICCKGDTCNKNKGFCAFSSVKVVEVNKKRRNFYLGLAFIVLITLLLCLIVKK